MSNRLNQEREGKLQPERMAKAKDELQKRGFAITYQDETCLKFIFKGRPVTFFPYSGWASGKTITDGRGLNRLLNQLQDTGIK